MLTLLRAALGPVVLALAVFYPAEGAFIVCLVIALLSDYFDGVIARRLGVATPALRRLDSAADTVFYVCATLAVLWLHPRILGEHAWALGVLGLLEVGRYAFDLWKFGREASYHMWSSKVWGLLLFGAFVSALGFGEGGALVMLTIYWGIACDLEGLAISAVLRTWRSDVPSLWHARRLAASADA